MRLIDADSLLVNMDKGIQGTARGYLKFYKMAVNEEPTAYDVDKVVERLQENAEYFQGEADGLSQVGNWGTAADLEGRAKAYRDAVDIIKSSGIE
ncbi:MAG: hypothetical protein K1W10_02275 [Lachnospiraceae bacterium]